METTGRLDIRPYRTGDRDGFARVVGDVLTEFGFTVDAVLEADLADPQGYDAVWVATDGDTVVGSAAIRIIDAGGGAELKRMYLLPGYRGRGAGRALLDRAIDWAVANRCPSIVLDTSAEMTAAQRLYESAGFTRYGSRTEKGAQDSRCELLYRLDLSRLYRLDLSSEG